MKIHVYSVAWNEESLAPAFLRHYLDFADRVVVYDNESTDETAAIIRSTPGAEVRSFDTGGQLRDDLMRELKENCWHESRHIADWVFVVDMDEFVWHPRIRAVLATYIHSPYATLLCDEALVVSVNPVRIDRSVSELNLRVVPRGIVKPMAVFRPSLVLSTGLEVGGHHANPVMRGPEGPTGLIMLHFQLNGLKETWRRFQGRAARMSDINRRMGWGFHYLSTRNQFVEQFTAMVDRAEPFNPFAGERRI